MRCVGKTERQLVSMALSMLGHVGKTRLAWLAGDGGRCLVGHGQEPGFFGLTFYLEIILKLQKNTKGIRMSSTPNSSVNNYLFSLYM